MALDFRETYIKDIVATLESERFKKENTSKNDKGGFSRTRKLPFINLVILITQGLARSLQRELNSFYQKLKQADFSLQEVTKSAFSHARKKLKWEAFETLNKVGIESFYKNAPYLKWNNYRLLSIDGSTIVLPNHPTIAKEFGVVNFGAGAGQPKSVARISMLYDVLNFTTINATLEGFNSNEREMATDHFKHLVAGRDLVVMDRGYPSYKLFYELQQLKIDFCVRMQEDWWKDIKEMKENGETDKIVTFHLNKRDWNLIDKYDADSDEITCRIVIVNIPDGGTEVLCTSLMDIPYDQFATLYHYRWNIEEGFKLYKCRLGLENFSGKTATAIRQDFYAKVFMMTTAAVMAFPIEEKIKEEQKENRRKHSYKVNRTNVLSMLREITSNIFMGKKVNESLSAFDDFIQKTTEVVRPNRKNERKHQKKKPPSINYKQL